MFDGKSQSLETCILVWNAFSEVTHSLIEDRHTGKQPKCIENKGWFPYGCYDLCDRNRCNHIETTLHDRCEMM